MKIKIRQNVFETNSSSVHSLTMVSGEEFDKFKNGNLILDKWEDELITIEEYNKRLKDGSDEYDFETFENLGGDYYETFIQNFETPNGEKIVAFGYYGMG